MNRLISLLLLVLVPLHSMGAMAVASSGVQSVDSIPSKDTIRQTLKEVKIEDAAHRSFRSTFAGRDLLKSEDIKRLPAFLGESDVLRALRLLPGIQSVSEGNSGVYVRGGSAGHNLFLLDDLEIFNPSHLMGLFSVFNPLTVGNLEVYKGNAPVQLQGRLASTILVRSVEPNPTNQGLELNVGTLSSSLSLVRSSLDGRLSVVLGYRRSYLEALGWVSSAFLDDKHNYFKNNAYSFEDLNGKIAYRLNSKTTVSLAGYNGQDQFHFRQVGLQYDAQTDWGNKGLILQVERKLNPSASFGSALSYSNTHSDLSGQLLANSLKFQSYLEQYRWKNHWEYRKGNQMIHFGAEWFLQNSRPLSLSMSYYSDVLQMNYAYSNTGLVAYLGDYLRSSTGKTVWYGGLRASGNAAIKPGLSLGNSLSNVRSAHVWYNLSPIVSVSHYPDRDQSWKASFSMNEQNVHLSSLSSIPLPFDLWVPSTAKLRPETADQLSLGYYSSNSTLDWSVEGYVKNMRNQLLFNIMTENSNGGDMESQFLSGKGFAYGIDLAAQKNWSIYTGKVRYSYARSFRSFPTISGGEWFKDKYDRPHDFNIQLTAKPSERWDFSLLWTYASGCNLSLPTGRWWMSGWIMNDYSEFNAFRLPPYHRLDVSANLHLKSKVFKSSVLNFSIVNLYNRANPYFAYFKVYMDENRYNLQIKSYQISLFPILPSISWRFKI